MLAGHADAAPALTRDRCAMIALSAPHSACQVVFQGLESKKATQGKAHTNSKRSPAYCPHVS